MAIGLEGHTVSLTKNGYFKLSELIPKYSKTEILNHLGEIKLDFEQARKMLAGNKQNVLPDAWDDVKKFDTPAQYALLLISIIYSHKTLIELFKNSVSTEMQGVVKRRDIDGKVYTNLAYALNEAGVATDFKTGADKTSYDFSPILAKNEIGPLAKEVLKGHLENMGWKEPTVAEPFQRNFYEQLKSFEFNRVLGISFEKFYDWLEGKNVDKTITPVISIEPKDLVKKFIHSIGLTGLQFSDQLLFRFISSLITKPFLILSGLSGSGKTQLAQAFTKWICQDNAQYRIVSVGADWTNREPILGYVNALDNKEYILPENGALELMIEANKPENQGRPYFLILDEMNLSHVERYFADFLSVMESGDKFSLHSSNTNLNISGDDNQYEHSIEVPNSISWPNNLFVVGTVNIDETTYMFSPKVLDRANVIEFRISEDEIIEYLSAPKVLSKLERVGAPYAETFVSLAINKQKANSKSLNEALTKFFGELKNVGSEFGYRTASEIQTLFYQIDKVYDEKQLVGYSSKIDFNIDVAIMQKLLPKLHGSRRKLLKPLKILAEYCLLEKQDAIFNERGDFTIAKDNKIKYVLSFEKIARMYKNAIDNGFTSYAEA
jgi:hypothetical protein